MYENKYVIGCVIKDAVYSSTALKERTAEVKTAARDKVVRRADIREGRFVEGLDAAKAGVARRRSARG